ncbi:hypothetical protein DFJ73DRAFT_838837, partial [Zopfochytrium polystomum]
LSLIAPFDPSSLSSSLRFFPAGVAAQADIQGVLGVIPFNRDLDEECKRALYTSSTVMDAYRTCGGLFLLAANSAPISVIQTPSFLNAFCSTNCTTMLQAIGQITACSNSAANIFYTTTEYNTINSANYRHQPRHGPVWLGSPFQGIMCPRTPDGQQWCIANEVAAAIQAKGLSAANVNSLTAIDIVSAEGQRLFALLYGHGDDAGEPLTRTIQSSQSVATAFASYMAPVVKAYQAVNCTGALKRREAFVDI